MKVPLTKAEYGSHKELRKQYVYNDTLTHDYNWSSSLSNFDDKIKKYLHDRTEHGLVSDNSLRMLGIPVNSLQETMFSSIVSQIIHYHISMNIGKYIQEHYEHYTPVYRKKASINKTSDVTEVEKIIEYVVKHQSQVSRIQNTIQKFILPNITEKGIEHYNNFLEKGDSSGNISIIENVLLQEYKILPDMIGYDCSKQLQEDVQQSVSFVVSSLIGWKYTTIERRCVGSASQFGSILLDIIFKKIKVSTSAKHIGKDNTNSNCEYLWNLGKSYYEPILSMDMEKINHPENPFYIGIKDYEYRQPEMYALWCIHNMIKTPFYDRSKVSIKEQNISLEKILYYVPVTYGSDIRLERKQPLFDSSIVKTYKEIILGDLAGIDSVEKIKTKLATTKSCLLTSFSTIITNFNQPLQQNNLDIDSITELVRILHSTDDKKWFTLLSQAISILFLQLIIAFDTDWDTLTKSSSMIDNIQFPLSRKTYSVVEGSDTFENSLHNRETIIKNTNELFLQYTSTLQDILGNSNKNSMGGLSLQGNNSFRIERMGKTIQYPGDTNVLKEFERYISSFSNDLSNVQETLRNSLNNLQSKYWYRDVIKWVEVMFFIFEPKEVLGGIPKSNIEIDTGIGKVENILKRLFSKKIQYIKRYIDYRISKNDYTHEKVKREIQSILVSICYISKQSQIILHILNTIISSWWVSSSPHKSKGNSSAFNEEYFLRKVVMLKIYIENYEMSELHKKYSKYTVDITEYQEDIKNCLQVTITSKNKTADVPEDLTIKLQNLSGDLVWNNIFATLYELSNDTFSFKDNVPLIYLPVIHKNKVHLLQIGNCIVKGNCKSGMGGIPSSLLLDSEKFKKSTFTKTAFVIVTEKLENISNIASWKMYRSEYFTNKGSNKKIVYRNGLGSFFLSNSYPISLQESKKKMNDSQMIEVLEKYMLLSNSEKEEYGKKVKLISIDMIRNIIENTLKKDIINV